MSEKQIGANVSDEHTPLCISSNMVMEFYHSEDQEYLQLEMQQREQPALPDGKWILLKKLVKVRSAHKITKNNRWIFQNYTHFLCKFQLVYFTKTSNKSITSSSVHAIYMNVNHLFINKIIAKRIAFRIAAFAMVLSSYKVNLII